MSEGVHEYVREGGEGKGGREYISKGGGRGRGREREREREEERGRERVRGRERESHYRELANTLLITVMEYRIGPCDWVRLQSKFTLVSIEYFIDSLAIEADDERFELSDPLNHYL